MSYKVETRECDVLPPGANRESIIPENKPSIWSLEYVSFLHLGQKACNISYNKPIFIINTFSRVVSVKYSLNVINV